MQIFAKFIILPSVPPPNANFLSLGVSTQSWTRLKLSRCQQSIFLNQDQDSCWGNQDQKEAWKSQSRLIKQSRPGNFGKYWQFVLRSIKKVSIFVETLESMVSTETCFTQIHRCQVTKKSPLMLISVHKCWVVLINLDHSLHLLWYAVLEISFTPTLKN